jgi:hypothetical protein
VGSAGAVYFLLYVLCTTRRGDAGYKRGYARVRRLLEACPESCWRFVAGVWQLQMLVALKWIRFRSFGCLNMEAAEAAWVLLLVVVEVLPNARAIRAEGSVFEKSERLRV